MYYLQVREEPLLPPVEDFQVPLVWNCGAWGGILRGGGGAGWWLLVDCWGLWFWPIKSCWFFRWLLKKPHLVSRISMRNGSHFDHPVGANLPNWWYLKLRWYPCSSGNDTLRVSGRNSSCSLHLFTWELWNKLLGDCGINMDKLVMKPEVWSINSKELFIFQGLNRFDFHPSTRPTGDQGPAAGTQRFGRKEHLATSQGGGYWSWGCESKWCQWGMVVSFWQSKTCGEEITSFECNLWMFVISFRKPREIEQI